MRSAHPCTPRARRTLRPPLSRHPRRSGDLIIVRDVATPLYARSKSIVNLAKPEPEPADGGASFSVLGEPACVVIPTSSFDISAVLTSAGLTVEDNGTRIVVSTVYGGDGGGSKGSSARKPKAVPSRAVGLNDLKKGVSNDIYIGVSALVQLSLVKRFNLAVFAFPSAPNNPRVFATQEWRSASTLVLVVPKPGAPAGVWSPAASLLTCVDDGSVGPLVSDLVAIGRVKPTDVSHVGVILLDPNAGGAAANPRAHLESAWDTLLASATMGNTSADVVFVTHGAASDDVISLLVDESRASQRLREPPPLPSYPPPHTRRAQRARPPTHRHCLFLFQAAGPCAIACAASSCSRLATPPWPR